MALSVLLAKSQFFLHLQGQDTTITLYYEQFNNLVDILTWQKFQSKRRSLSLTLMDQGQTNNPNLTHSSYQMKFWHLFGMVAPIAHITQKSFLIGPFAKSDTFHWSRCFCQYLDQYLPSPNEIFNHRHFLHIHIHCVSHISYVHL